jgi:hypothetical protein
MGRFTLLEPGGAHDVDAELDGSRVLVSRDDVATALGWARKPEGLCRDDECLLVAPSSGLDVGDRIELSALARLLRRPLALDVDAGAAFLGESAAARSQSLTSLVAPDFTLPDLAGTPHSLSEHRGKKVFLVAWASW